MKSLLRKLSRADRPDRREQLESEAAERIREVGGQAPPEAFASSWAASAAPAADPSAARASDAHPHAPAAAAPAPAGRRLTVQERLAARELQSR